MTGKHPKNGLKGWLILVGFSVLIKPSMLTYDYFPVFFNLFEAGHFNAVTTPGNEMYHVLLGPLIIFELVTNSALLLLVTYLIYLFFAKHHRFPTFYIGLTLANLMLIPLDAWFASFVMPEEPMFDAETKREIGVVLFSAIVWVPYMIYSERVKATFIEGRPTGFA